MGNRAIFHAVQQNCNVPNILPNIFCGLRLQFLEWNGVNGTLKSTPRIMGCCRANKGKDLDKYIMKLMEIIHVVGSFVPTEDPEDVWRRRSEDLKYIT